MRMWKKSIWAQTQRLLKPSHTFPRQHGCADVEMQDVRPPPGFEPEVVKAGYDVNLVRSGQPEPGSSSPVTAHEDRMLDVEESQPRAPGNGRLGHNPDQAVDDQAIDNQAVDN